LLLAGSGLGMMASQLGAVTVSSVPDEKSAEVGGLQNTGTQLGASIGTALAGAVLISALTASFFTGIQNNPNIPHSVVSQAQTQLAGGVPFMSKADAEAALKEANVSRLSNPAPRPSPDHPRRGRGGSPVGRRAGLGMNAWEGELLDRYRQRCLPAPGRVIPFAPAGDRQLATHGPSRAWEGTNRFGIDMRKTPKQFVQGD
jgi:hypothetical protein